MFVKNIPSLLFVHHNNNTFPFVLFPSGEYPTFLMFAGALLIIIFIFMALAAYGLEL